MALPPEPTKRSIVGLNEVVVVRWSGEWIQSINHLSKSRRNSEADEIEYKRALAYWARYPEEEWWRITSVRPLNASNRYPTEFLELEITFLNPGKAYEAWLANPDSWLSPQPLHIPIEIAQLLQRRLNPDSNAAVREVRQEQPNAEPPSQRP